MTGVRLDIGIMSFLGNFELSIFLIECCEDFDLYSEAENMVCSTSVRGLISQLDPDSNCPLEFMLRFESRLLEFVTSNS